MTASKIIHIDFFLCLDAAVLAAGPVPDGTGRQVWIDNLRCRGNERRLIDCPRNGFGSVSSVCTHSRDIGVTCQQFVPCEFHQQ